MSLLPRLAVITTHPIQYYAPFFKMLNEGQKVSVKVFYTWSQSQQGPKFDPGFGKNIAWDIPLLEGYDHTFVNNISKRPGTHHFMGIINPTLNTEVENWQPDALLIIGWSFHSHLKCMRYFHKKVPILFRGDSTLLAEYFGVKLLVRTIFLRWVYKFIDYALYVGTNNKLYFLRHGVKEHQLKFAPHAVDNNRFYEGANGYEEKALLWRNELGIKKDDVVFLYAGKLEHKKDPGLLIGAFKQIYKPDIHLIILGNGPLEKELKKKYLSTPNLHFIDFQNQSMMPVAYRLGNILVLPSKGPIETWGLSVNEAMACSRVIIASNRCGCSVDLIKDGVNGYTFRRTDMRDLVDKMKKIYENKNNLPAMGIESLKIIQDWSFEKICMQIENIVLHENSGE